MAKGICRCFWAAVSLGLLPTALIAQELPLSSLDLGPGSPAYTLYTAPLERSHYLVDQGYRVVCLDPQKPLSFETDTAGKFSFWWKRSTLVAGKTGDYRRPPRLTRNFADAGSLAYSPLAGIEVRHDFALFSSAILINHLEVENQSDQEQKVTVYILYERSQPVRKAALRGDSDTAFFTHKEPVGNWIEGKLKAYLPEHENMILLSQKATSSGGYPLGAAEFEKEIRKGRLNEALQGDLSALALATQLTLKPGASKSLRIVRTAGRNRGLMWTQGTKLLYDLPVDQIFQESARAYLKIPRLQFEDPERELLYWQAFSLLRQRFMPPEGLISFNYHLPSREPTWGWAHEGQELHMGLSMLTYVHMDPQGAMDAQRAFMERQAPDGYIPNRVGPYVVRDFPHKKKIKTSSAPFFSWVNWEVYQVSQDRLFLEEAYYAGQRFADYWTSRRDQDGDGLYEWGGQAARESVRSGSNAVWDLLGKKPQAPGQVEALDLNCLLVAEMKALAAMATQLELADQASAWRQRAEALSQRINAVLWDDETGFYYHADRDSNTFRTRKGIDLRRMEMIGFLPLWAGIAPPQRAQALVRHLSDPATFQRRFGVPSLSAADPSYDASSDPCCRWNGPLRPAWNYLIFRGLLDSGRGKQAAELAQRNFQAAIEQLRSNHIFAESYNPDHAGQPGAGPPAGNSLLARMMIDLNEDPN